VNIHITNIANTIKCITTIIKNPLTRYKLRDTISKRLLKGPAVPTPFKGFPLPAITLTILG
jgi:hypothetical protein